MKKIDTTHWREFSVLDFFELLKGRRKLSNVDINDIGTTPVYSSNSENCGIFGYTKQYPDYIIDKEVPFYIVFGDHTKSVNIAQNDFCVMDNVKVLTTKLQNKNILRFIITSWLKNIPDLGYARHWSVAKIAKIYLPVNENGQPDWAYMETYMKQITEETQKSIENLKETNTKLQTNVSNWGEFQIKNIFEVVKGTRLTKANMKDGNIKFVGSSAMNNGETHRIANNEHLHSANTITVCYNGSVGETFYQDEEFWASDDVNVLYPKFKLNKYIAFFICPIIKSVGQKYAFVDKWKQEDMKTEIIKLPITQTGEPDWQYMENYMKNIISTMQNNLTLFQAA